MSEEIFEKGMAVRKAVLGAEYVARAEASKTDFDADFQRYVTEHAWGAVWTRPGLEKRIRSMLTIAMLASLGRFEELGAHIRATRNTGVTREEVKEILLQVAVYAGAPAANAAFAVAKKIYQEIDEKR
ncbi:MAG TPA: 4-carboxymuconolactone decarboxylase [Methylomirabilota bacterium]|nr:4-carboxymuconolactone decarboxylase [Methylomirabilota bacterium]